ncbi:MAG: hypothetical protein EBS34_09850 [Flavobacteriales bacterium]|nr:hypothetical protein [Flavobacteriales bacterium]
MGISKGSFANSSNTTSLFSYDDLPKEIKDLLEYHPEINQTVLFIKQCWTTKLSHTAEFRVMAARVCQAIYKCLCYVQLEINGIDQTTSTSNISGTIEQEIYFAKSIQYIYDLMLYMKLNASETNLPKKGSSGSMSITFTADALSCLNIIESWDPVANIISSGTDLPSFNPKNILRRMLYGTMIARI